MLDIHPTIRSTSAKPNSHTTPATKPPATLNKPPATLNKPPATLNKPLATLNKPPATLNKPPAIQSTKPPAIQSTKPPATILNFLIELNRSQIKRE